MLRRLADIKRRSSIFFLNAIKLFYFVTLVPFLGLTIGLGDPLILLGARCQGCGKSIN